MSEYVWSLVWKDILRGHILSAFLDIPTAQKKIQTRAFPFFLNKNLRGGLTKKRVLCPGGIALTLLRRAQRADIIKRAPFDTEMAFHREEKADFLKVKKHF